MMQHLFSALALCLLLAAGPAAAAQWQVDHERSRLGFTGTQQGGEFTGRFERFQAQMQFDPNALGESRFNVTIDVTSITTGSSQRDRYLDNEEWFDTETYPEARFVTKAFRHVEGQRYEAGADLTIKGQTHEITLPFTWTIEGDTATMKGEVTLDRTRYNVGTGEWSAGDTVGRTVIVHVDLTLTRAGG